MNKTTQGWTTLPLYTEWKNTCDTLHLWMQCVGKIRLVCTPPINHSWHVTSYVTSRGLTTSPIPYGSKTFDIDFDFVDHVLRINTSQGEQQTLKLEPRSVANFYEALFDALHKLDINVEIDRIPSEMVEAIPFDKDFTHCEYDAKYVEKFLLALVQADRVLKRFRGSFVGKCSPVHFFWGSMDLAVTRFSGNKAPQHPGGVPHLPDSVAQEAYSREVSSCGFWAGDDRFPQPAFYAYAYPEPVGFAKYDIQPEAAFYSDQLHEFILPYENVCNAADPDETLLEFLQTTYAAAANLANWDRQILECPR